MAPLERDDLSSSRHPALAYWWSMIFSENRFPLFGIMLYTAGSFAGAVRRSSARKFSHSAGSSRSAMRSLRVIDRRGECSAQSVLPSLGGMRSCGSLVCPSRPP
jgi:hypothetical protein